MADALYERIGVTDLVASDAADCVRLAVRLASSPEWRRDLSRRIAESGGILLEDRLAVRELETFLVAAVTAAHRREPRRDWIDGRFVDRQPPTPWRRWLARLRRRAITVAAPST